MDERELTRLAARGALAGAITGELAKPLAHVAEALGQLVDRLDRHVAVARGPEPLSWNAVGELRQQLADLFLEMGHLRRLTSDLAHIAAELPGRHPEPSDVNDLVERALSLSRHRIGDDQELFLDLGTLPPVEVDGARFVHALAHLLVEAAQVAGPGATLGVRTGPGHVLSITFPGRLGNAPFSAFIAEELRAEGGGFTYTEADGLTTASVTLRVAK